MARVFFTDHRIPRDKSMGVAHKPARECVRCAIDDDDSDNSNRLYKFKFEITITSICRRVNRARDATIIRNPFQMATLTLGMLRNEKIILNASIEMGLFVSCVICAVERDARSACECENWTNRDESKEWKNKQKSIHSDRWLGGIGDWCALLCGGADGPRLFQLKRFGVLCMNRVKTQRLLFILCRRTVGWSSMKLELGINPCDFILEQTKRVDFVLELSHSGSIRRDGMGWRWNGMRWNYQRQR